MDRRRWLTGAGMLGLAALTGCATAGVTGGTAPGSPRRFFVPGDRRLGVQLYALAPELDADFDGTLAALARMGIGSVETAGFHGRTAAQLRASFDRAGLECRSAHIPAMPRGGDLSLDGDIDVIAREMHTLGVTTVVLPAPLLPRPVSTLEEFKAAVDSLTSDDWKRTAAFLNTVGARLHARGLATSYHNHNVEFTPHEGVTAIELLLRETDPALVTFELDAGWAAAAGQDPVTLLRAHPTRFTQMHVKDIKRSTAGNAAFDLAPTEVGYGIMDWPAILAAGQAIGMQHYYIEQEPPYVGPRIDSVAKSAAYLLSTGATR